MNLQHSYKEQRKQALSDIQDRFMQVYELSLQHFQLQRVSKNANKLQQIEEVVRILNDNGILGLKESQWPQLKEHMAYLTQFIDQACNQLPVVDDQLMVESIPQINKMLDNLNQT